MTVQDVTSIITALTGLAIAVGGVLATIKVLTEIRAGTAATGAVHDQLNSAKTASDQYQQDLRTALTTAGVPVPDDASLTKEAEHV